MFIVDAHQDIAFNRLCFGRDYRVSALKKRREETSTAQLASSGVATIGLPEAIAGRVALVFATIFVAPHSKQPAPWSCVMYRDAQEAYKLGLRQLDYYNKLADEDDRLCIIHTAADLDDVLETWKEGVDIRLRKQGLVILMENADPILEPKQFEEWYERGVRIVGPAWTASRYAGGTGAPGSLTPLGHELLDVMMSMNTVLDLSHLAEDAYFEAIDQYEGSVIASHANPRHFCDTDRHLSDDMIRRLAERDGVMGVVLLNFFLNRSWSKSDGKHTITLSTVADIIDHICQVTGSVAHVGIGSDFDGGFGVESIPAEIDTIADLWKIADVLRQRGFSENDIAAVLGGNMLRKLREALP